MSLRLIKRADILDEPADALIYSTNVLLNCTGGVGGALMGRFGPNFQSELHHLLAASGRRFADQGEVFQYVTTGLPYKAVFHTVPCNGWYDTTAEIVGDVLRSSLNSCAGRGDISKVVLSALATGYGHFEYDDFIRLAARVLSESAYDTISEIALCVSDELLFATAQDLVSAEKLPLTILS